MPGEDSNYNLTYFNSRGFGEAVSFTENYCILHYAYCRFASYSITRESPSKTVVFHCAKKSPI